MEKIGGKAVFIDKTDIGTDEIAASKYAAKTLIVGENFGVGSTTSEAAAALKKHGIVLVASAAVAPDFAASCENAGIKIAQLDKKSYDDAMRTFADKDAEATLITNDDGSLKFKLISGSLSKSYML